MDQSKKNFSSNTFFSQMVSVISCSCYHADECLSVIWGFICCWVKLRDWQMEPACDCSGSRDHLVTTAATRWQHLCPGYFAFIFVGWQEVDWLFPSFPKKVKLLLSQGAAGPTWSPKWASTTRHLLSLSNYAFSRGGGGVFFFNTEALAECRGSARGKQQTGQTEKERVNV